MQIDLVGLFEPKGPYWYWNGVNPVAMACHERSGLDAGDPI
jgi:cytosine/uracil/thiamine/allantoin permease